MQQSSEELSQFWRNEDLIKHEIPSSVSERVSKIDVKSNRITINDCEIFYLEVNTKNALNELSVLLLHGMSFSSKTWLELETILTVSAFGYRTVAIDLQVLLKFPVIISPRFSGHFSLPFMLKHSNIMSGYVPVSPVGNDLLLKYKCSQQTTGISIDQYLSLLPEKLKTYLKPPYPDLSCVQVPKMIVFCENDNNEIWTAKQRISHFDAIESIYRNAEWFTSHISFK